MTSLGFWVDMWDVWELDLLRQAAIAKRLSVYWWLCGGILLDWFYYMDPCLEWPCSLVSTVLPLLETSHGLCSEFTKPQALLYLNLSWHTQSFIFTCLNRFFFSHRGVTCTISFYLPQFPMAIAVQRLEPLNLKAWTGTMKTSPL